MLALIWVFWRKEASCVTLADVIVVTVYHQLEQMVHELDEKDLASVDPQTQEALRAVKRVHVNLVAKAARLKERCGL